MRRGETCLNNDARAVHWICEDDARDRPMTKSYVACDVGDGVHGNVCGDVHGAVHDGHDDSHDDDHDHDHGHGGSTDDGLREHRINHLLSFAL